MVTRTDKIKCTSEVSFLKVPFDKPSNSFTMQNRGPGIVCYVSKNFEIMQHKFYF